MRCRFNLDGFEGAYCGGNVWIWQMNSLAWRRWCTASTSTWMYGKLLSGRNCVAKENQGTVRILSLWQWWGQQLRSVTFRRRYRLCAPCFFDGVVKSRATWRRLSAIQKICLREDWKFICTLTFEGHAKALAKAEKLVKYAIVSMDTKDEPAAASKDEPANKKIRIEDPEVGHAGPSGTVCDINSIVNGEKLSDLHINFA